MGRHIVGRQLPHEATIRGHCTTPALQAHLANLHPRGGKAPPDLGGRFIAYDDKSRRFVKGKTLRTIGTNYQDCTISVICSLFSICQSSPLGSLSLRSFWTVLRGALLCCAPPCRYTHFCRVVLCIRTSLTVVYTFFCTRLTYIVRHGQGG